MALAGPRSDNVKFHFGGFSEILRIQPISHAETVPQPSLHDTLALNSLVP